MATQSRRGRPAPKRRNNPALPLYGLLGLVIVAVIAFVALGANRSSVAVTPSGTSGVDASSLSSFPSKGSADAPVTVIEYADYQCPGCAAYANNASDMIDQQYVDTGKVRFIYHELPIPSHANAYIAAEAARAAGDQGKYWEMNKILFAQQNDWASLSEADAAAKFATYAQQLGLDVKTFSQTLTSGKYRSTIEQAYQEAIKANIQSTPSFVIDGEIYSAGQLQSALDTALAAK